MTNNKIKLSQLEQYQSKAVWELIGKAIEVELLFKSRKEMIYWPKYQCEVRFNNYQAEKTREETKRIYKSIKNALPKHFS